jgi:DNA polymerase-4
MVNSTRKPSRIFAHLRFHGLEAAVEEREHDQPVILLDETGHLVASASPEALRGGVHVGLSRWEAEHVCPQLIIVTPDPDKYDYFWRRALDTCGDYSPTVRADKDRSIALDLTGTERLFGPAESIARELCNRLRAEIGVTISAGLGPNPTVARLASQLAKPDRILSVSSDEAPDFVGRLPVSLLPEVSPDRAERLADMGIRRAKDLALLPVEAVERAFGEWGRRLWETAQAKDPDERSGSASALRPARSRETLSAQTEIRPATDARDRIQAALRAAADELARKLRQSGQVAQQFTISIVFSDLRKVGARRTLGVTTRSPEVIFQATHFLFEKMKLGNRPVRRVRITATRLASGPHGGQLGLPLTDSDQRRTRLADHVDRVKDRFGETALTRASASSLAPHS